MAAIRWYFGVSSRVVGGCWDRMWYMAPSLCSFGPRGREGRTTLQKLFWGYTKAIGGYLASLLSGSQDSTVVTAFLDFWKLNRGGGAVPTPIWLKP